jgi:hypothetical protein
MVRLSPEPVSRCHSMTITCCLIIKTAILITVYHSPTKGNKLPFSVSVLQQRNKSLQFPFSVWIGSIGEEIVSTVLPFILWIIQSKMRHTLTEGVGNSAPAVVGRDREPNTSSLPWAQTVAEAELSGGSTLFHSSGTRHIKIMYIVAVYLCISEMIFMIQFPLCFNFLWNKFEKCSVAKN